MLALEGLKVLDLTHLAPGMYCTMFLGDLGADVLRVERPSQHSPQSGADTARWSFERMANMMYEALNRNKRSITLNLKSEKAHQIVYQLAQKADVVLEGFRPGVAERLGVDYETLKKTNPRLIYCAMSGYGQDGPYSQLPGHDINYISVGGALDMIGQRNGPHAIPMNFIADWAGATLHAVIGILAAVIAREKTGRGQYIDISYTDGVLSMVAPYAYDYLTNGITYRRGEALFNGGFPCYNVYETKDGKYLTVGALELWFWENLCRALGREDFIPYQFDEGEKHDEISSYFQKVFRTKTREEWFDFLKDKNIPIGKVYSLEEVFTDPQVLHRQMLIEVEHPTRGRVKQTGFAIKLSDTPAVIRSGPPIPGQHTAQVLTELGYTKERIDELSKGGAIQID
jgi:crotonobetainyl-CoA:carnitine CoA-transferase CaiB-like acyl-CoA transferase